MRAFRLLALGALALSATACTLWFALDHPYDGLGAEGGTDAESDALSTDGGVPDASAPSFVPVASGVGSIAAYGDVLYANVSGELWTCDDAGCATLQALVHVDASTPLPPGLAVDDAGVFWVTGNGIWGASLDGSGAGLVIQDDNNPRVVATDGPRVSWTTQDDAGGSVVRSCATPRKGGVACKFLKIGIGDAGAGASGIGGPEELVDAAANVDNAKLAAGSGFVVWVQNPPGNEIMTYTPVDGGSWTPINPMLDQAIGKQSNTTLVANDGPAVFFSFYDGSGSNDFALERSRYPTDTQGTELASGTPKQSNCLGAGAGVVAYCPSNKNVIVLDENDGGAVLTIPLGDAGNGLAVTATPTQVFYLDKNHDLWRFPRN